ncbi:MAG: hypothetical protein PHV97_03250 [Candidatus Omnitrophica bacterium]|nr:hypothetical protein [Candidatus Omnitrophota bacterium]
MRKNSTVYCVMPQFLAFFFLILFLCPLLQAEEVAYDSGKRRDPFVALTGEDVSMAVSSSGVKLEGIIYDPVAQSMAILNGKTYQAGEVVGDAKVVKILKDHVIISVDGEEKTLWIRKEEKT